MKISKKQLLAMIESTLLKPNATIDEIGLLCEEAMMYHFGAACVRPFDVKYVTNVLKGSDVDVCTVIGFPWGIQTIDSKVFEAQQAIYDGATQIDMVINRSYLQEKDYGLLEGEIKDVVDNSKSSIYAKEDIIVKTILETSELTDEEIIKACEIARSAGADFVKTSTGAYKGATVKAVRLMHKTVPELGVKASGGIRGWDQAYKLIKAGATRLGTSSGLPILDEYIMWKATH